MFSVIYDNNAIIEKIYRILLRKIIVECLLSDNLISE